MNKLTNLFFLLILSTSLYSQQLITPENFWGFENMNKYLLQNPDAIPYFNEKISSNDEVLAGKTIDRIVDAAFTVYGYCTPIVYEPISGTLAIVQHLRESDGTTLKTYIYTMTSTNLGTTWSNKRILFQKDLAASVWPSLGLVNINNTKDPNKLVYLVMSIYAERDPNGNYPWKGGLFTYASNTENLSENETPIATPGTMYWQSIASSFSGNGEGFVYHIGHLLNQTTLGYADLFGISGKYLDEAGYDNTLPKSAPDKWNQTVIRRPDQQGSTYRVPPQIDVDADGNVYVANFTFFTSAPEQRVVGFTKSTNYGQHWSDWETMPYSLIEDFVVNEGSVTNINYFGSVDILYSGDAFIVNDVDDVSYFVKILTSTDGQRYTGAHLAEARFKNGIWTLKKVTDFEPFPMQLFIRNMGTGNENKDSLLLSSKQYHLQAAKTADGKHIILKWIQSIDKVIQINPPFVYNTTTDGNIQVTELYTNDVFMAYRPINGTNWSQPVNVTNDDLYNKLVYIPTIVPSIKQVPMIELKTVTITNTQHPRYNYHPMIQQMCVDAWLPQDVLFTLVDITNPTTTINEQDFNLNINELRPNPVFNEISEFSFTLDKPYFGTIELYNALGQKIKNLYTGEFFTGFNAFNINTSNLNQGIYYVVLTIENKSYTKILSITR